MHLAMPKRSTLSHKKIPMQNIFFDSWHSIIRTIVITILAYIFLIFMLRISGKRTLSKMNAFDFIITIALGSTFASVSLNKNVALADGVLVLFAHRAAVYYHVAFGAL